MVRVRVSASLLKEAHDSAVEAQGQFYRLFQDRVPSAHEVRIHLGADAIAAVSVCLEAGDTGWMGDTFLVLMDALKF